jgi:hypothetical protein
VGKTAVVEELCARGLTAYDADDRALGLMRLEVAATGEPAEWPEGYVDWHYYSWNANEARLKELLATNDTVFIAGLLGNQEALYHLFDTHIALTIDPVEHERRLRSRPKRAVGDDEKNILRRLERYQMHIDKFIASGFTTIDNNGPTSQTVNSILQTTGYDDF